MQITATKPNETRNYNNFGQCSFTDFLLNDISNVVLYLVGHHKQW